MAGSVTERRGGAAPSIPAPEDFNVRAEFKCTSNNWDQPFDTGGAPLCRQITFKSMTPDSWCTEFSLLGYKNGNIYIGITLANKEWDKFLNRHPASGNKSSLSSLYFTNDVQPVFRTLADNSTFLSPELQEKVAGIIERGKCDPCNLFPNNPGVCPPHGWWELR